MSDTFLPGSGFDTYESQDKVLVQMDGSRECAVAVRILQQQGFAVAGAAVRLAAELTADAESAKKAAEALGIECIVLNAEALAGQDADVLGEGGTPLFAALLTAADKLGMQYVATTHRARVETGADGVHTVCPPAGTGSDDSTILAALPQETLARLILPLGDFAPEDVAEMAEDFKVEPYVSNGLRCTLAIFCGNIIFILEFRKICGFSGILFFTGKAAAAHGICCFCFLRKQPHGGRNAFCGSDPIPVKMKI